MVFWLHLLSVRDKEAFSFTLKMEAAGSTKMLAYTYQNVRRHFQWDIIHRSLYTENHIKNRTTLYRQNSELFVVLFKAAGKLASIDIFIVCLCGLYITVGPLSELRQ
jgi:adenylate kinase family enzyme